MKKAMCSWGVSIALVSVCIASAGDDAVTLKRVAKVGDSAKYSMVGHMSVQGGDADYTATMSQTIAKVDADGGYTMTVSTKDVKIVFGGQEMTPEPQPDQTTVIDAKGAIVSLSGGGDSGADSYRFANLNAFGYPENAVKIGDSWTKDVAANAKTGATAVKSTYKYVAREKVGDYDSLKITFMTKETGADAATIAGTVWLNAADGALVKTDVTWTAVPVPGAPGPVDGKITMTRIG